MKIKLKDVVLQESTSLLGFFIKDGNNFNSSLQKVNELLTNIDVKSERSVELFLKISDKIKNKK